MINYYLITKPGIILGNLITVAAGFLLASKGQLHPALFLYTMLGMTFIMASACVLNNYIDRPLDQKMERTKNRPLAQGLISGYNALIFASLLGILGNITLLYFTNLTALLVADFGLFVYVVLYSLWKSKTIYGTAIGSIAGAVPPVVGFTAVSNQIDLGAIILFAMLVLWQMPHFFAIALYRFKDYVKAEIPVLPIKKGIFRTKVHMILYIIAFMMTASLLTFFKYMGDTYLIITLALSTLWLALSVIGFKTDNDTIWGRDMFRLSLILITLICLTIPFDVIN